MQRISCDRPASFRLCSLPGFSGRNLRGVLASLARLTRIIRDIRILLSLCRQRVSFVNDLPDFATILREYALGLEALDTSANLPQTPQTPPVTGLSELVVQALLQRDVIQQHLETGAWVSAELLIQLQDLDQRLRHHRLTVVRTIQLGKWRSLRNPPATHWWWYFEPPARFPILEKRHPWLNRLDWLWTFLSLFSLTLAFTIVLDTLKRVVGEGLNTAGMLPVVIQIVLTIAGGTAALTSNGREFIESTMARLRIPKHYWAETSVVVSGVVLALVASIFVFYIPQLATQRYNAGNTAYETGQFDSALNAYQQAIALQPNFVAAHYSLGALQEDLQRTEAAIAEYQLVTRSDPASIDPLTWLRAHNNLARLYILQQDYSAAWTVLDRAHNTVSTATLDNDDIRIERYNLLKNLGWVWLAQERLIEADEFLLGAIDQNPQRAAAHCLRAQVLEGLTESANTAGMMDAEIREAWNTCLTGERRLLPEEAEWAALAQERLLEN